MAEHTHSGPAELGAPMDYAEHERTFPSFVALTKITILATIAMLHRSRCSASASGGFWLGTLLSSMTLVATAIAIVAKGSVKPLVGS